MLNNLDELLEKVKSSKKKRIVVVSAADKNLIKLIKEAADLELADFILVGEKEVIEKENISDYKFEIIDEKDHIKAARLGVELLVNNKADSIMKGLLHTSTFLKAVLDKEKGINKGNLISQISIYNKEYGEGLQLLTDCAMAIKPDLSEKKQIIENAVELAVDLGYVRPKVALLSALEVINEKIPDTVDAAVLSKMGDRGQIKNAVIDGPFALDNAISPEAAKYKNIKGEVAGKADILVVPDLQVGNVLTKSISYIAKKDVAAAVMGASRPIIMNSRTDSIKNKLLSIALAAYISE